MMIDEDDRGMVVAFPRVIAINLQR